MGQPAGCRVFCVTVLCVCGGEGQLHDMEKVIPGFQASSRLNVVVFGCGYFGGVSLLAISLITPVLLIKLAALFGALVPL